jgi:hypothetical protein
MITTSITRFNITNLCILPTQYIYVFRETLAVNRGHLPEQPEVVDF